MGSHRRVELRIPFVRSSAGDTDVSGFLVFSPDHVALPGGTMGIVRAQTRLGRIPGVPYPILVGTFPHTRRARGCSSSTSPPSIVGAWESLICLSLEATPSSMTERSSLRPHRYFACTGRRGRCNYRRIFCQVVGTCRTCTTLRLHSRRLARSTRITESLEESYVSSKNPALHR